MKRFYTESGIRVCEWDQFEKILLDKTREFHFTQEQWRNRKSARTHVKPQERLAMMAIVNEIRNNHK